MIYSSTFLGTTTTLTIFQLYRGISIIGGANRSTRENHQPTANHWQTLSHNAVSTVENSQNNAGSLVNSLKIKRQICIFKTYIWFICIRHCIHNTKSWLKWINFCGKLMQTLFSRRVSFTRSLENTPIEIMLGSKCRTTRKEMFRLINNYMPRRRIVIQEPKGMGRILKWPINHNIR